MFHQDKSIFIYDTLFDERKKAHIGRKEICRNGTGVKGKDILTNQNAHESEKELSLITSLWYPGSGQVSCLTCLLPL